ncbi:hypothetical protein HIM_02496 [Hirsutella minnesotensis 3608]|nr:hypothetical protein HIM_02496 [Hirsutella minnesotensis 3608]
MRRRPGRHVQGVSVGIAAVHPAGVPPRHRAARRHGLHHDARAGARHPAHVRHGAAGDARLHGRAAGIANGRLASGPRGFQDTLRKRFPEMKLAGDKYRWVRDGNFWSSGGVTNGNDLMAAYARASKHWDQSIVEIGLLTTDVGDRGQIYGHGQGIYTLMFVYRLLSAWVTSLWPGAKAKNKAD